ncbi:MAG: hypothetical protein PHH16_01265 [Candidatus Gracilibacteria bacterium]|nr:hypothetical protein [Candidatus Gracilibacteria bacterium]
MSVLIQIELLMTVALFLYGIAYAMARNKNKYHKAVAAVGFSMDTYGTMLMFQIKKGVWMTGILASDVHTILSLAALSLFFIQLTLGLTRKIKWHRRFALRIFFPVWALAFLSGAFLAH